MKTADRRRIWGLLASIALVTTLLAGCGTPSDAHAGQAVLALMPRLRAFVEETRKLTFMQPVDVVLLNEKDFSARLNGGGRVDDLPALHQIDEEVSLWRAFGLIRGPVDLVHLARAGDRSVAGFYSPGVKRLFVHLAEPTPFQQMVLVHELTHALEDQYFDITRPFLTGEARLGWRSLVEGSARMVEQRFYESRSPAEQRRIDAEVELFAARTGDIPAPLAAEGDFPYSAGRQFVETVFAQGSVALNEIYNGSAPASSEQVLHPDRWASRDQPVTVIAPQADGPVRDSGVLGEAGLRILLHDAVDRDVLAAAATGWGGDRYVVWGAGKQTCARLRLVMDTPADKAEALDALRAWAARVPGATVEASDDIVTRSCGDA